ncbi:Cof-type HAD-IIB family hydrolase [Virgibacillus sp. 179-BFC.A HS]|uniref:Cof-type HAD-IIB family hydrolase n=1 Tax=Tigheibacillus jepli TaxID=3035914 RepID=A0ABU5CFJ5_9BACI|nr:Cof-type HAD-IIB family hydrolase [Virgibacillus sp. 179-BFC.A HS]MDY0405061.1 Cof-type HAD-IIB family hydrolase [Virgibacillus sp. 179-BFC.A HS]
MAEIKLIALDMDGTLLNSENRISEQNKRTIKQAMEQNVHVVLSTGRWLGTCYPYAEELRLQSYLITSNGGQIFTMEKELVEEHLLETESLEKMYRIGEAAGADMWLVSTKGIYRDGLPVNFKEQKWLKFGCVSDDLVKMDHVVEEVSKIGNLELTNSMPNNLEVNPIGVNKANALRTICKKLGITMENVLAAGDSLNDIKMIEQAGVGVAMGNAQNAVKKVADYVTADHNDDGVAKAIERFVLQAAES